MGEKKLTAFDEMVDRVAEHEGYSATPYLCPAGRVSIGHGTNLEAHPELLADIEGVDAGDIMMRVAAGELRGQALLDQLQSRMEWSEDEAREVMVDHLERTWQQIYLRWPWVANIDPERRGVLVEMAYQLGVGGLAGFRRMLRALALGDYDRAAAEMLDSRWARQIGDGIGGRPDRAERLADIMRGGGYDEAA